MNKVSDELHNAAVGISMVQGGGSDGTLDDVDDNSAAQQRDRTALDKPEIMRQIGAYLNICSFGVASHLFWACFIISGCLFF